MANEERERETPLMGPLPRERVLLSRSIDPPLSPLTHSLRFFFFFPVVITYATLTHTPAEKASFFSSKKVQQQTEREIQKEKTKRETSKLKNETNRRVAHLYQCAGAIE